MSLIAASIVAGASRVLTNAEALLKGVTPAMAGRFASPGGKVIVSNHASFVLGHLALYPAKFMENAGRDHKVFLMPQRYTDVFAAGVECKDDVDGTIYPPLEEIVANFKRSHTDMFKVISEMTDADFAKPPAHERSRAFMPTLGALTNFYFLGHTMLHLGQLSAWRRMMGLPAAA